MRIRRSDVTQQAAEDLIRNCVVFALSRARVPGGGTPMTKQGANEIFDLWLNEERLRAGESNE